MTRSVLLATVLAAAVLVIIAANCHKTPTEEIYDPQLLLNQFRVAVVPEGSEYITVTATDEYNMPASFSVECDDEEIAAVTKTDTAITITGVSYGTTTVRVSCNIDTTVSTTIPVQVYDPRILEAGELLITYVDTFEYRWSTGEPGYWCDASFYHPVTTDDFKPLGSLGFYWYHDPNGRDGIVVVKAKPGSDALKPPVDYQLVWDSRGAGTEDDGSLWNPVPPAGYKALGTVAQQGYSKPSLSDVVCVREDLTVPGALGGYFFHCGSHTGGGKAYSIDPPNAGAHDSCYLKTGTFTGARISPDSTGHPVLHVLRVDLPKLAEAPDQDFAPRLTGYDAPPEHTQPVLSQELSVPCGIVNDLVHPEVWRYANSPNYRVERQVYYVLRYHHYNQTSQVANDEWQKTVGASEEARSTYWQQTGVSLSVETGVSFKGVVAEGHVTVTGTVSRDLGYERQTGITEFEEHTAKTEIAVAPRKAGACWQKFNRFIVKRHNGNRLEPVATLEFGMDSYVTDEYPHDE